jgi:outer membrane protein
MNKEVDELQKKFNTQGDKLNDEARADLLKQIDSKKKQLQRSYEDANTDIQAQQNDIANKIGQKLVSVLDTYAKTNGFTLILDVSGQQSPVLWAASSVDITQAVVETYNTQSGVPAQPKKAAAAESKPGAADAKK